MKRNLNDLPLPLDNKKKTCYVFTYNNYTEEGTEKLKTWLTEKTKYAVFGREVGEAGTPHLQGYFSLKTQKSTKTIQNELSLLEINLWLNYAKGNPAQNREYCSKQDANFWEHGEITVAGRGQRTELLDVVDTMQQPGGATAEALIEKHPVEMIKYFNNIMRVNNILRKKHLPEFRDITVTVYYGEGGTGKTSKAICDAKAVGLSYYILSPPNNQNQWYDNYTGEGALILDDFYGWLPPHDLYRVLDRYKLMIPIKGSHEWALWTHVWITSNVPPDRFYKPETMAKLDPTAYNRRIHNIYYLSYANDEKTAVRQPIMEKELKACVRKSVDA